MEITRYLAVRTQNPPEPIEDWVVMSVIIPHMPKFITIAPLGALWRMHEISPSQFLFLFFCDPKFLLVSKDLLHS